ncbi:HEAT repeat domain-containing protein [Fontivita pretiosa]|uniref:HEAT repeat domain-containing protein n=1 Tax=Fontivita pretiosa TaxID=2989684 RepID=UPI003D16A6CB
MIDRLIEALVQTENAAADQVLLEALRLGEEPEKLAALDGLIRRDSVSALCAVVGLYEQLPAAVQQQILNQIRHFHPAVRQCGRSDDHDLRRAAMKLIALARQAKLAYVLSENLHDTDEELSKPATEAMVALARWISTETRRLQQNCAFGDRGSGTEPAASDANPATAAHAALSTDQLESYLAVMEARPEIEAAVARAMDVHRGRQTQELLRAALLLCDWPGSRTLAILQTSKHGGQSAMVRRLQQPPASEHVEAFLLGATHGGLRSHFGVVFSHIEEAPVLDALLRRTHWLRDHQLQICMHQVTRGVWWGQQELKRDIDRRPSQDAVRIGEWIAASGMHDTMQDQLLEILREHARDDFASRLRLLRIAARRKRGGSVLLLRSFLHDTDERLVRMAAREIIRRRPLDYENMLLQLMTGAAASVRRVISRAIGHEGFDQFWQRFDQMDKPTRRQAGRAMLKLLPDAVQRLSRRLAGGTVEQRVKAMQIVHELGIAPALRQVILPLCSHPNPRVRSKAILLIGQTSLIATDAAAASDQAASGQVLLDKVLHDADPRVRANAIEVLEARGSPEYVALLTQRARSSHNRERANAIKALHKLRVGTASAQLLAMLRDDRPEHRISALWVLRQIGWWQLLNEVGRLAKADGNLRVRRYALGVLRNVADLIQNSKGKVG